MWPALVLSTGGNTFTNNTNTPDPKLSTNSIDENTEIIGAKNNQQQREVDPIHRKPAAITMKAFPVKGSQSSNTTTRITRLDDKQSAAASSRRNQDVFTDHVNRLWNTTVHYVLNKKPKKHFRPTGCSVAVFIESNGSHATALECDSRTHLCVWIQHVLAYYQTPPQQQRPSMISQQQHDVNNNNNSSHTTNSLSNSVLRYNVSLGVSNIDMIKSSRNPVWGTCFANSAPQGDWSVTNFEVLKVYKRQQPQDTNNNNNDTTTIPWSQRDPRPIFRGSPRYGHGARLKNKAAQRCPSLFVKKGDFGMRSKAVLFGRQHPHLLNAAFTEHRSNPCDPWNATNGLDQVFGWNETTMSKKTLQRQMEQDRIPSQQYYQEYQTALVLQGIGAAFRTAWHFRAGQCVLLHRGQFEEWFVPYLEPYVHYIPVAPNLEDLETVLEYVRDHPGEVEQIARNGRAFFEAYLSRAAAREHWYRIIQTYAEGLHTYHALPSTTQKGHEDARNMTTSTPVSRWSRKKAIVRYEWTNNEWVLVSGGKSKAK